MIEEFDTVALQHNLSEHGLEQGDVGTVVHTYRGGEGLEVEFLTGTGDTVAVVTLSTSDVRPLGGREILHAGSLATA